MDILKMCFPNAYQATEIKSFLVSLSIYVLIDAVCAFVIWQMAELPLVGMAFALVGGLVGLYAGAGIVLSILVFTKVLK